MNGKVPKKLSVPLKISCSFLSRIYASKSYLDDQSQISSGQTFTDRHLLIPVNYQKVYTFSFVYIFSLVQTLLQTFSRFHIIIKQYLHFQSINSKQYYIIFQSLQQAIRTLSENPSPIKLQYKLFSEFISLNTDTFRELLTNDIDLFRAHIKQHSHFQSVINKQQ